MRSLANYEFCAFSYLDWWLGEERRLYNALSSDLNEQDIRDALRYFGVARTFKGLRESSSIEFIQKALAEICAIATLSTVEKVEELASRFEVQFKKRNLSAASKLLWLSFREPYVIYDTRAVKTLREHFKHRFEEHSYKGFSDAWRIEYSLAAEDIRAACQKLPQARTFMRCCSMTDTELLTMVNQTWFKERVFDVFLWEVSAKESSHR